MQSNDTCTNAIISMVKSEMKQKLEESKRRRDRHADGYPGIPILDYQCAIISSMEATWDLSPRNWHGTDEASEELFRLMNDPSKTKDNKKFRALIGPEFEEIEYGKVTWFPPRIFLKAMLEKMPVFMAAATAAVTVGGGAQKNESMHHLLVTANRLKVSEIIADNQLEFVTLPKVLILDLGLINRGAIEITEEESLLLVSRDGESREFKFKASIYSIYEFHSAEVSFWMPSPDIIIFESTDSVGEIHKH